MTEIASVSQRRDDAMLMGLAAGLPVREVATQCSVNESTVFRKLRKPEFCQRLAEVRGQAWNAALSRLSQSSIQAVGVLDELMTSETESIRMNAAKSILSHGMKLTELLEFHERLQRLEGATENETDRATIIDA